MTMVIHGWSVGVNVSCSISQIQSWQTHAHRYVHYDSKNRWYVSYSLGIANPCDPSIHDPLNTDAHFPMQLYIW